MPERAVDGERVGLDLDVEPLRQHDLVDVAGRDVLLPLPHRRLELLPGDVRPHDERRAGRGHRLRQTRLELPFEEPDLRARKLVERVEVVVGPDAGVGDEQHPVAHVVEGEDRVEDHEAGGRLPLVRRGPRRERYRLEPGRGVVAQEADRAAGETWKPWHGRRLEVRHQAAQRRNERFGQLAGHASLLDRRRAVTSGAQHEKRILPEERVTPEVLSALDALEQERVIRVPGDLQEGRHRRQ